MNKACVENWFWFGDNSDLDCIVYCRLGLYRSIAGELFPHRCTNEDLEEIQTRLLQSLSSIESESQYIISPQGEMDCLSSVREVFDVSSISTVQPGQAVILGSKGFFATINMNAHLYFSQMGPGTKIIETWKELIALDERLDHELEWACMENYGFLNPDPHHIGSGLECEALLFLPGIMDSSMYERVMKGLLSQGFELSVYNGDDSQGEVASPFVKLHYTVPPGMSEQEGIERIKNALDGLITGERATRERLAQNISDEIADSASRAFGVLSHARLLEKEECRTYLSDVRKGLVYNCVHFEHQEGLLQHLDRLWFTTEALIRQNLELIEPHQITEKNIKSLRAKLVRSILSQYHIDRGI
jgi:protein arginine kinase